MRGSKCFLKCIDYRTYTTHTCIRSIQYIILHAGSTGIAPLFDIISNSAQNITSCIYAMA